MQRHAQQREQHKRAGKHQHMQTPMPHALLNRLARQLRPMHEKQQRNRRRGQVFKAHFRRALHRQHTGEHNHADEQHQKAVYFQLLQPIFHVNLGFSSLTC